MYKYCSNLLPECIAHLYLRNDSLSMSTIVRVLPGAQIWNVLSNKINCDVSMSIFKCYLKLFLSHNELVLNYPK